MSGSAVFPISEASTSKVTWGLAALVERGLLRRPSIVDSPMVTSSVQSTTTLLRLREHMINHSVDFVGGDFNMSAFSTVGDVSLLWGLGSLDETCREYTGFIIMPSHPHTWRVGCYKFDSADMGFGPRDLTAHFPAFLHLRVTNLPRPDTIMRSDQARQRRMEEEIMDFQWFDNIPWDSIKDDLRGATCAQPPPRFKFALQQAQHAVLRAIMHNNPSSLVSEPAWKALVLSSWLLLGRPAVNASESNCAHYLDARLDLFWAEDWPALWAMVRAECDVAPVHSTTRRTTTEQEQSRIRKVATLARSGATGRAPAAVSNAPPVPVTEQIVQESPPKRPTQNLPLLPRHLCQTFSCQKWPSSSPPTLRKMPRLSEPAPLGMRAERWYDFGVLQPGTATCLRKLLHTVQPHQSHSLCCSTSRLDRSRHSPNPRMDTDRFS